jgi:hypothetical protein
LKQTKHHSRHLVKTAMGLTLGFSLLVGCNENKAPEQPQKPPVAEQQATTDNQVTQQAEQPPAQDGAALTCTPTWDATLSFAGAHSGSSAYYPDRNALYLNFCLKQVSRCGTLTKSYQAYAQNSTTGAVGIKTLNFTVGSGANVCQRIKFESIVHSSRTNVFSGKADNANQIAETNETNNTWNYSFKFYR